MLASKLYAGLYHFILVPPVVTRAVHFRVRLELPLDIQKKRKSIKLDTNQIYLVLYMANIYRKYWEYIYISTTDHNLSQLTLVIEVWHICHGMDLVTIGELMCRAVGQLSQYSTCFVSLTSLAYWDDPFYRLTPYRCLAAIFHKIIMMTERPISWTIALLAKGLSSGLSHPLTHIKIIFTKFVICDISIHVCIDTVTRNSIKKVPTIAQTFFRDIFQIEFPVVQTII